MKVSVIGAGNVGAKAVYYIAEKNIADIVMVDVVNGLASSKALDFLHAAPLRGYEVRIRGTTDFGEIEGSDVVVITAGIARKPGMDRMDLLKTNVGIAAQAAREIALRAPNAVVIVVTNPLDVISMVVLRETGFALRKVVGMAGVLDSTRFRWFIAEKLGVWPGDVQAMVLGGHGDEMVPLTRYTSVGGIPLDQLLDAPSIEALVKRTRTGGAEIVSLLKTGSAFYAPGASVAKMVEAVIKDERRLFPASAYLRGEYGFRDIYLGVPVIMGRNGVERVVELPLADGESEGTGSFRGSGSQGAGGAVHGHGGDAHEASRIPGQEPSPGVRRTRAGGQESPDTPAEAETIAREIGCPVMVKAQVLVGGRGKAGGVKMAADPKEAAARARDILGMKIKGIEVQRVLVARAVDIAAEYYVSLTVDRAAKAVQCIASASGGMEIEEIAVKEPHKIIRFALDPEQGLVRGRHFDALARAFAAPARRRAGMAHRRRECTGCSRKRTAPWWRSIPAPSRPRGSLVAADAKVIFDDNALYRHPELESLRSPEEYGEDEMDAKSSGLSYVGLDGTIGCIVNGAGLSMATMDLIKYFGGSPANFLDVGGSSNPEKVLNALRIISKNPRVTAILINIFGGITRCDDIARGHPHGEGKDQHPGPADHPADRDE